MQKDTLQTDVAIPTSGESLPRHPLEHGTYKCTYAVQRTATSADGVHHIP